MSKLLILFFILISLAIYADTKDLYQFATADQKTRFTFLTQQFRCLVCQNETLADSNAPLAQDLKVEIAHLIQNGQSDQQVQHYLIQRYGEYILFNPPFKTTTYILWLGPFLLLIFTVITVFMVRWRR